MSIDALQPDSIEQRSPPLDAAPARPAARSKLAVEKFTVFIIWSAAAPHLDRIVEDLKARFRVARVDAVHWRPELVMENYRRFYCDLPVRGMNHLLRNGEPPFTAITLWDTRPKFAERLTERGIRKVNVNFADAKNLYLEWAGGVGVYCSDTPWETARDLTLIYGIDAYTEFCRTRRTRHIDRHTVQRDLVGAEGWQSTDELFQALNCAVKYVYIEDTLSVSDAKQVRIPQLLTDDYVALHAVVNPVRALDRPVFGGTFTLTVADRPWPVGLRFLGDGYFDERWARRMLAGRVADEAGIYRPPEPDRTFSALFDGCVRHSRRFPDGLQPLSGTDGSGISSPQLQDGESASEALDRFLDTNEFTRPRPKDAIAAARGGRYGIGFRALSRWVRLNVHSARRFIAARAVHRYRLRRDDVLARRRWLRSAGSRLAAFRRMARHKRLFAWRPPWLRDCALFVRGLCFLGGRYQCPCCRWRVRGFMGRHGWPVRSTDGYCPRCNVKARHRRIWRYLREQTDLFGSSRRMLEIGPSPGFAALFSRQADLDYVSVATDANLPRLSVVGDVGALPFADGAFDVVLCQHVLEHVSDDRGSLAEIRRVVSDRGWALISVPIRLREPTYEDPSVTDPDERTRLFGEPGHVRYYGYDLADRLAAAGFEVSLQCADDLDDEDCAHYGLRKDEHLFMCRPRPRTNAV